MAVGDAIARQRKHHCHDDASCSMRDGAGETRPRFRWALPFFTMRDPVNPFLPK
jgi:hypothetical protein